MMITGARSVAAGFQKKVSGSVSHTHQPLLPLPLDVLVRCSSTWVEFRDKVGVCQADGCPLHCLFESWLALPPFRAWLSDRGCPIDTIYKHTEHHRWDNVCDNYLLISVSEGGVSYAAANISKGSMVFVHIRISEGGGALRSDSFRGFQHRSVMQFLERPLGAGFKRGSIPIETNTFLTSKHLCKWCFFFFLLIF